MSVSNDAVIAAATTWLRDQVERLPFGEIELRLILHAGRVARVEKTTTEKEQPGA